MQKYLEGLNEAQREAVLAKEGPSLVIAGAGSGKTRVLTYKIAHLLATGVAPWSILSLTFTNKAAREMQDRIGILVGEDLSRSLWMGTFHSIFGRILRTEAEYIGFPSSFTIYDSTDSKSLIKSIIKELKLDDKVYKPAAVLARISMAKNNLITSQVYKTKSSLIADDRAAKMPEIFRIYQYYSGRCKQSGAMDFDDMLLYTNILFRDNPEVLAKYQDKFKYILVDEYQDTNLSQYLIIKKLAQQHNNICVVGDDAQSIYSFRGAKIENILNFKNDYPSHRLFKLEQNYRSTQTIVNAANSLIKKNEFQIKKDVFSENDEGELVNIIEAYTDREEGYLVVNDIFEQRHSNNLEYKDFAILYRTNAQSRIFEEALRKRNMPYKIYGGLSFYQRKEIKDLIAYFRVVVNPDDTEALKRIINYPARGIGLATMAKLEEEANNSVVSVWRVLNNIEDYSLTLNKGTINKLNAFVSLVHNFIKEKSISDAYDMARMIASETGILKDLHNGNTVEERSRYENIEELLNGINEFVIAGKSLGNEVKLENFLENVALLTDQDTEKPEDNNRITLMTIHSAKGLEFPHVYIVGMEEKLFPSDRSVHSQKDLEEERRLFYVALTRAEMRVTLSFCKSRMKYGSIEECKPSRFIKEIDKSFINRKVAFSRTPELNSESNEVILPRGGRSFKKPVRAGMNIAASRKLKQINKAAGAGFVADNANKITSGVNVEHPQFGQGRVIQIEGEDSNKKAVIFFPKFGEKKLLLRFAKLKIID